PAAAFTLTRTGGGAVAFTATADVVGGVTVVTLDGFSGAETQFGSLADGRYTLTALAGQITAGLGGALDGNGDGTGGEDYGFGDAQGLFRFYGDANGERRVDVADLGLFAGTYLRVSPDPAYLAYFDFNADGRVDVTDLGQFAQRYLTVLP